MMDDPAVLDQIIQASPELRAMGPQVRQISALLISLSGTAIAKSFSSAITDVPTDDG